jgi:polysaccharide export outer membrane protein
MKNYTKYIILFIAATIFSSCYTRYSNNYLQERKNLPQYKPGVYEDYKLQVNDEVVLRLISRDETLKNIFSSGTELSYRIYGDGTVDFPFISHVPLVGKTLNEAEKIVEDSLLNFSPDVRVKMALKTATFCVIGAAGRGYYSIYKERLTIFQALAMSGGMDAAAKLSSVKIVRTMPEGTVIKTFDIRSKSIIDSEFYYIQPNDIIYCDYSPKRFWAANSYSGFLGLITTSITFVMTVWNWVENPSTITR